jgi:hypothetical protein
MEKKWSSFVPVAGPGPSDIIVFAETSFRISHRLSCGCPIRLRLTLQTIWSAGDGRRPYVKY